MEGELLLKRKRTGLRDSWQPRHFIFDGGTRTLRYYQGTPQIFKGEKQVRGVDPRGSQTARAVALTIAILQP